MRGPFLIAVAAGVLSLLIAFAPAVWRMFSGPPPSSAATALQGAPWQVDRPAPGTSRVFGLTLPGSTLAEVQRRWGEDVRFALIAQGAGAPVLEAYVEKFEAAGIGGRLLLAFDADATALARWQQVLPGTPTPSGARQHALPAAAFDDLAGATLQGLSFIPAAQLSAEVLSARFGAPAERISSDARLEHWLYPALGLAVVLDAQGRDVLQYTAPADFDRRLVAPLRAASAPPG